MGGTFAIIAGTSIVNLLLAGLILLRSPNSLINRLFGAFALSIVAWTACNYLADYSASYNLILTRLAFGSAIFIALSLYYLSSVFPLGHFQNSRKERKFQLIFSAVAFAISMSPLLVPSVTKTSAGVELAIGYGYSIYLIYMLQLLFVLIKNFHQSYVKSSQIARAQIKLLLTGIIAYAILAMLSNLVLPMLVDSWSSSRFGPVFTLVFVAFTAYAIVRHKLLDIKLIVARSLAYIASLAVLIALFVICMLGVTSFLLKDVAPDSVSMQGVYVAMIVVLAITFGPLKKFFDKFTNNIFYRDAYDPQEFLDELNASLVNNIELRILLRHTALTIEKHLKSAFCFIGVRETDTTPLRIVGSQEASFSEDDIKHVRDRLFAMGQKVIVTDDIAGNETKLKHILVKNNIAVIVRLKASADPNEQATAYLVLGSKKSGNVYGAQDLRIINIIADELVIAIQNALRFEEIQGFAVTLQSKVNDATKKLRKTNEKLKELDETKDDFISMASHQLRTPLTSVKGYISMVLEEDAGKITPMQREMLSQAFFSSQRMVYLIADLLNVSRLKTGKFVIDPVSINMADVIEEEITQLKETAAARQLKLEYNKPKNFPDLMLDETKIRQVIMNFIDNAIYYTPAGGKIKVKLIDEPKTVELRVEDSGIGVPKSEQPHLFTKFYRAGNARKARPDGTGLGLFMAKKVIVAQGGSTIFESKEGKGSTFGFIFNKKHLNELADELKNNHPTKTSTTRTQATIQAAQAQSKLD